MTKKETTAKEVVEKTPESVYSVDELAQAHRVFNASFAIVETALKLDGKAEYSKKEAQKIVDDFKNREV